MITHMMKRFQERKIMVIKRKLQGNKIARIATQDAESQMFVLVGTYKKEQNQLKWIGKRHLYNYPLSDEEAKIGPDGWSRVKELWLYSGAKDRRRIYTAEFVGIKSRKEFLAEQGTEYELLLAEENRELARSLGIMQAPTAVIIDGDNVEKYIGVSKIKNYVLNAQ